MRRGSLFSAVIGLVPGARWLRIVAVLLLALGGALYWLLTTVRWQEAYRALGVQDAGPHAIAWALTEGEAPIDLPTGARLHAPGSLVRLRYDILDAQGALVASHEVRALVPALPFVGADAPGSEFAALECRAPCRAELAARGAVAIERGGKAGLADEWVLRLPKGESFSLDRSSLELQDIAQSRSRRFPVAPMRVTLLEACPATVRIGTATHLEYFSVPIPRGLRTTHWVQLEGCTAMMDTPPAVEAPEAPRSAAPVALPHRPWVNRADYEAVRPAQSGSGFRAVLAIDEEWLALRAKPRRFHLLRACRYEPATRAWTPLPAPEGDAEIGLLDSAAAAAAAGMTTQRLAYRFPAESALYFAEWTEIEDETAGAPHRIMMPSGAGSCVDATRVTGAGEVFACVPQSSVNPVAEGGPVPDPAAQCVAGDAVLP